MFDPIHILLIIVCLLSVVVLAQCLKVRAMNTRFDERLGNHCARLDRHHEAIAGHTDSLNVLRTRAEHHAGLIDAQHRRFETLTEQLAPVATLPRQELPEGTINYWMDKMDALSTEAHNAGLDLQYTLTVSES